MKTRPFRRLRLAGALLAAAALSLAPAALAQAPAGETNQPPPLPKEVPPFEVAQYNAFTWYGRFGYTNCSWIDLGDGIAVIDTGWSLQDGKNLLQKIKETTKGKPVKWIVMTHLHGDSNGGLEAFLPTEATIFMNARAALLYARSMAERGGAGVRLPAVVGVGDRVVLSSTARSLELIASPTAAHTAFDLVAFSPEGSVAWVGDLITTGRCPMLNDPACDPKGWLAMLDKLAELHPAGIIPTRGEPTGAFEAESSATRRYLDRVVSLLKEFKEKKYPEAQVASELVLRKIPEYCPIAMDNTNALALYRRLQPDGSFAPVPSAENPAGPRPSAPRPTAPATSPKK